MDCTLNPYFDVSNSNLGSGLVIWGVRRVRKIAESTISFVMSVCLSDFRPHVTTRLPLDGFS